MQTPGSKEDYGLNRPKLVSIVMPAYNCAKYISLAIESCLAQTFQDWELIIVDDCSTDDTPRIVKDYVERDARIVSIRNQRNLKLPAALNVGFRMAKGDYFGWIAADDCYHPEALEQTISYLEDNPRVDLVYTDFATIDADGTLIETLEAAEPESLAVRNGIGPCRVYRRAVHEKLGGYDETLFLVEDYDFFLRAFCLFQLHALHQTLYLFRLHTSGLTASKAAEVPPARDLAKEKNLRLLRKKNMRLAAKCHASLIDPCLARQETLRARRHAFGALRCSPVYTLRLHLRLIVAAMVGRPGMRRLLSNAARRWQSAGF